MQTQDQLDEENKEYITGLDGFNYLSSGFIREIVSDEWDGRRLTDEELANIMDTIFFEDLLVFIHEHISMVIGHNCPDEKVVSKSS